MKNRKAVLAALLLSFAPLAAFADPLTIDKGNYKLTYPDGWTTNPIIPTGDSASIAMKDFGGDDNGNAMAWTHGQTGVSEMTAAQYVTALTMAYQQGLVRTDSSVKNLGGKNFHTTGWRDTAAGDSAARVRIYVYQQGSFLFVAWVVYDHPDGAGAVAEVEAALATLQIKVNSIHRFAWNRQAHQARARIDILGRTWQPGAAHIPKGPFFLKR